MVWLTRRGVATRNPFHSMKKWIHRSLSFIILEQFEMLLYSSQRESFIIKRMFGYLIWSYTFTFTPLFFPSAAVREKNVSLSLLLKSLFVYAFVWSLCVWTSVNCEGCVNTSELCHYGPRGRVNVRLSHYPEVRRCISNQLSHQIMNLYRPAISRVGCGGG